MGLSESSPVPSPGRAETVFHLLSCGNGLISDSISTWGRKIEQSRCLALQREIRRPQWSASQASGRITNLRLGSRMLTNIHKAPGSIPDSGFKRVTFKPSSGGQRL